MAAAREMFEEAVCCSEETQTASLCPEERVDQRVNPIARSPRRQTTIRAVIERERLRLALDTLVLFAHWVTPPIDARQFDTRFFMTRVPPDQTPAHDDTETTHSIWTTPADAIAQSQRGEIVLPPPTWSTIRELEPFTTVDEALGWARRRRVVSRRPLMLEQDGVRMLIAPGDPLHPDPAGDEPPAETRFVFVDGGCRQERPMTTIPTSPGAAAEARSPSPSRFVNLPRVQTALIETAAAPDRARSHRGVAASGLRAAGFTTLEFLPYPRSAFSLEQRAFGTFAASPGGPTGDRTAVISGALYLPRPTRYSSVARMQSLSSNRTYFIAWRRLRLAIAVTMNVVGLDVGKWLNNVGAIASWIVAALLISLAAVAWSRFGSATPIEAAGMVPSTSLKDVIFWSTIAFAFGGVESASTMGEEIRDAPRTIPRAILTAGALITVLYSRDSQVVAIPRERFGLQVSCKRCRR